SMSTSSAMRFARRWCQAIWRSPALRHRPLAPRGGRRPAADAQRLPVRGAAQIVGQGRIVYAFGRHNAADAQGGKCKCALAPLRLVPLLQKDLDQIFQYLTIRSLHFVAATPDIPLQPDPQPAPPPNI